MANEHEIVNMIKTIFNNFGVSEIVSCKKENTGYNRLVYEINNKYILKICSNTQKEQGIRNELDFFLNDKNDYHSILLKYDFTKSIIPFIYTIEEKIEGYNLFDVWAKLSVSEKEDVLNQLINIFGLINSKKPTIFEQTKYIESMYDSYLDKIIQKKFLSTEKINYLLELKKYLGKYFQDAAFGYIHGDIHFNNIIYTEQGIKLIDFECYGVAPLDKELDSLNRMTRNPNSFTKKESQILCDKKDYDMIMPYIIEHYSNICKKEYFEERLLIYDCLNSLKWLLIFPNYELYNKVLFEDSKKLIYK